MFSTFAKKQNSCQVKVLVVDFYDSFTYNLVHYLESLDCELSVILEDKIVFSDITDFNAIILSPGPGLPKEKKNLFKILELCRGKIPVLGICLGFQGIAQYLGYELKNQKQVKHGVSETINVLSKNLLFKGLPDELEVGLYHSWMVDVRSDEKISAVSSSGVLMAMEFPQDKMYGVQFHPESIMTPFGKQILANFLSSIEN
jgi:anthranilate synthase component 2